MHHTFLSMYRCGTVQTKLTEKSCRSINYIREQFIIGTYYIPTYILFMNRMNRNDTKLHILNNTNKS